MDNSVKKKAAVDTSSILLLNRVGSLSLLLSFYETVLSFSVLAELDVAGKEDSRELIRLLEKRALEPSSAGPEGMGQGEADTIALYNDGKADLVVVDDKKAAAYCRKNTIPFINSLLVPKVFCLSGAVSKKQCNEMTTALLAHGYYSEAVRDKAEKLGEAELERFLVL